MIISPDFPVCWYILTAARSRSPAIPACTVSLSHPVTDIGPESLLIASRDPGASCCSFCEVTAGEAGRAANPPAARIVITVMAVIVGLVLMLSMGYLTRLLVIWVRNLDIVSQSLRRTFQLLALSMRVTLTRLSLSRFESLYYLAIQVSGTLSSLHAGCVRSQEATRDACDPGIPRRFPSIYCPAISLSTSNFSE